jgi:hypothetical protein
MPEIGSGVVDREYRKCGYGAVDPEDCECESGAVDLEDRECSCFGNLEKVEVGSCVVDCLLHGFEIPWGLGLAVEADVK